MVNLFIPEGHVFLEGRSRERASELLEWAKEADLEGQVSTTSTGYIVPKAILPIQEGESDRQTSDTQTEGKETKAEEEGDKSEGSKPADVFNPADNTIEKVLAYLETADNEERARVLEAEKAGKNRPTLITNIEGAK